MLCVYVCVYVCVCGARVDMYSLESISFFRQYSTLQHAATRCNTLQHAATHCYTLQHTATHCYTLQHTATHHNILQTPIRSSVSQAA